MRNLFLKYIQYNIKQPLKVRKQKYTMKREIFEVHMTVVDANGTISIDPGNDYPKSVDSRSYDNDINKLNEKQSALFGKVDMDMDQTFSDVAEVNSFDRKYVVYIYSFRRGDVMYSFVCKEKGADFDFYYITGAGDESA